MTAASTTPFFLIDLDAPEELASDNVPALTADDIDAAHNAGHEAGMRDARNAIDQAYADELASIADTVASGFAAHDGEISAEKARLRETTRLFLESVCSKLCADGALSAVETLIDQVLDGSDSREPVTLFVSKDMRTTLANEIAAALKDRGVEDFFSIRIDPLMRPGEARIAWRGGSLAHDLAPYLDLIDTLINEQQAHGAMPKERRETSK